MGKGALPIYKAVLKAVGRALLSNAAFQALIDEQIKIALVADRDRQAAVKGKLEARIVAFLRRRHAPAARYALRVLSKARR
jgi:hypothetical protein